MQKAFLALSLVVLAFMAGCQGSQPSPASAAQSSSPQSAATQPPAPTAKSGDAVTQKLQELAGSGATDCGRVKFQQGPQDASSCAMQAAKGKRPFFVAYELPGLTVAIAGNTQGKLFSVQSEQPEPGKPGAATVNSSPCPAELRVAESGRVTCIPRGSMPASGGSNPHGGMSMPPTQNPHGGMGVPPPGTPNPHSGGQQLLPRTGKSKPSDSSTQQ